MSRFNFKMKSAPPPGFKKVGDWQGQQVRILREMRNYNMVLPAGTLAVVECAKGGIGLKLTAEPCKCCGVQVSIRKVSTKDVELVTPNA